MSGRTNKYQLEDDHVLGHTYSPNMVILHVYHLHKHTSKINQLAQSMGTGLYHAGLEVYGREFCFGQTSDDEYPGITENEPGGHAYHVRWKRLPLGETKKTEREIEQLLNDIKDDWKGSTYHILKKNCITFADYLASQMGDDIDPVPQWVKSAQEGGAKVHDGIAYAGKGIKKIDELTGFSAVCKKVGSAVSQADQQIGFTKGVKGVGSAISAADKEIGFTKGVKGGISAVATATGLKKTPAPEDAAQGS
eukprot:GDKI01020550.1.p1 GENE.GDKI01020550.1~~GDKI01020550.1.p1  ORF type:complete len:280 (+),score=46.94 GDKI01020550.1:93-842(+)